MPGLSSGWPLEVAGNRHPRLMVTAPRLGRGGTELGLQACWAAIASHAHVGAPTRFGKIPLGFIGTPPSPISTLS